MKNKKFCSAEEKRPTRASGLAHPPAFRLSSSLVFLSLNPPDHFLFLRDGGNCIHYYQDVFFFFFTQLWIRPHSPLATHVFHVFMLPRMVCWV